MKNPLILIIPAVLIAAGVVFFWTTAGGQKSQETVSTNQSTPDIVKTVPGYQGVVLGGNISPYLEFNQADYQKALAEGKIIVLNFYANWCPICRVEAPDLQAGFDSLTSNQIVGFRVNFNDSDTDSDEKALASQFNVPYQHTKVILKNGQEVTRSGDQWDKETFESEIQSVLR